MKTKQNIYFFLGIIIFAWLMSFVHHEIRILAVDHPMRTDEAVRDMSALAENITRGAGNEIDAVLLLAEYTKSRAAQPGLPPLYDNPNAWYILDKSQGYSLPCGKSAILLGALARGSGFETRVIGLSDFGHVLTEIKIDDRWVMVDTLELGAQNGTNHLFMKDGEYLSAKEIYENPEVIPKDAIYGEEFFSKIHYDTYESGKKYFEPDYMYGREWAHFEEGEEYPEVYGTDYSGVTYATSVLMLPLFFRIGIIYHNIPLILHFDIFLVFGLISLLVLVKYKVIRMKKAKWIFIAGVIIYLAAELCFWRLYFTGVI